MMTGDFVVDWPGWCPLCKGPIRQGDVCRHNPFGQVVHAECEVRAQQQAQEQQAGGT